MKAGSSVAVGIIGGTGPLGRGLAARLATAGAAVQLGSRDPQRAQQTAEAVKARLGEGAGAVGGGSNLEAAAFGDLSLITVPYEATSALLADLGAALEGRTLISTAAPMEFRAGLAEPVRPRAGSAAQEVAELCPGSLVVGAYHTVSAASLGRLDSQLEEDVIVTSDHARAKTQVMRLVEAVPGLRAVDGGGLANARFSEGLTPFLLQLNRLHRARTGIKITGITTDSG